MSLKEQTAVLFEPVKLDADYNFVLPDGMREVFIPVAADAVLNGLLYEAEGNTELMVYFQGNAKNLQNFLDNHRMVLDWGYNVLVVDYRSFGKSGGELLGHRQLYADAEQVYNYALFLGYQPSEIILYGYSMGGAMVAYLAANKPAKAVILESTYSSVAELDFVAGRCPIFRMDNVRWAADITMPALIIHGAEDDIIRPDHAERVWEKLDVVVKEKHILEGGGHGDLKRRPEYKGIVNGFIAGL